jgi:hypothetical protein
MVGVVNVGDVPNTTAPEPVEVVTPVPPEATAKAFVNVTTCPVLIDTAVVPFVWSASTPVLSALDFSPAEPLTAPLSALIVTAIIVFL